MKEKKNYIDNIPKINDMKWEVLEDGIVEITVENTGFYNTIAQKIFKKPRYSFIKLDEYGSFVWQKIDVKVCRALDEMFEESTNKGIQMGIRQGIEQGIALNQFEVYQTMLDKGFSVKDIASIFSVSEESIKTLLMRT